MASSFRDLVTYNRGWITRPVRDTGKYKMTIMTWNVLADGLNGLHGEKSKTFAGVPAEWLEIRHRVPLMLCVIAKWNCDIICFQEFDFYKDDEFMTGMDGLGYAEGVRQEKKWSPCLTVDPRLPADGVSIFFKRDKFEQRDHYTTDQEQHKRWLEIGLRKNPDVIENGRLPRDKIVQLIGEDDAPKILGILDEEVKSDGPNGGWAIDTLTEWMAQPKPPVSAGVMLVPRDQPDLLLYIMTTHLVASKKPKGEQQRHDELRDLLDDQLHRDRMNAAETFLCFDMNGSFEAINGYAPKAYPYLTGSTPANAEMRGFDPEPPSEELFKSATRDYERNDHELAWSSWKKRNTDDGGVEHMRYGVDFIFYPTTRWNVTRVSALPTQEEMRRVAVEDGHEVPDEDIFLPNKHYPSDHIAVCCELQLA